MAPARNQNVCLITGASGFVGRYLTQHLLDATDWDIVGLSRSASHAADRVRMLTCDLTDADLVNRTVEHHQPDCIVHLAAQSYVPKSHAAPAETLLNNVGGTVNLLEACRRLDLPVRILVVSSGEIYGHVDPEQMPINEEFPFRPQNPYAVSKVTQDMLGFQYHAAYGMDIVRARPFNHIGPGQSRRFVVATFANQVAEAEVGHVEPVILTGNLEARRDFLDVRDVVRAYRLLLEMGHSGDVYNVASGKPVAIQSILDWFIANASRPLRSELDPARARPSDTPIVAGDASKLGAVTGWTPQISLEQSLQDTLNWERQQIRSI